jgi:hypothetical protein
MKVISPIWYNKTSRFSFAAIIVVLMANDVDEYLNDAQTYAEKGWCNEQLNVSYKLSSDHTSNLQNTTLKITGLKSRIQKSCLNNRVPVA